MKSVFLPGLGSCRYQAMHSCIHTESDALQLQCLSVHSSQACPAIYHKQTMKIEILLKLFSEEAQVLDQLEIRSIERGIRPIATLYFAVIPSFFEHLKTLLVNKGTNFTTILDVIGHVIKSGWFPIR